MRALRAELRGSPRMLLLMPLTLLVRALALRSAAHDDRLRGRKLTTRERELVSSSPGGMVLAASEADATTHLDNALDVHERPPERGEQVAYSRELSGVNWLDSVVVMLSLGTMSILANGATVTAAAIATAFLLAPRYVGSVHPAELVPAPLEHDVASDALALPGTALPAPGSPGTLAAPAAPAAPVASAAAVSTPGNLAAVLPAAQAHWVALVVDGLPATDVLDFLRALPSSQ